MTSNGASQSCWLIDDDEEILVGLKNYLSTKGFLITTFSNPNNALSQFTEKNSPDIIIVDNQMPELMGTEFIQIIKEEFDYHNFIMISGNKIENYDGVKLKKPFDPDELLSSINDHLDNS